MSASKRAELERNRKSKRRPKPRGESIAIKVLNPADTDVSLQSVLVAAVVARMLSKAEKFNRDIINLPIPTTPKLLSSARLSWTLTALDEEQDEFEQAHGDGDVLEAADALIDTIYFALGRLVEMGVPAEAIMDGVQRANMSKVQGSLSKRPGSMGHDAIKPEGWTPPDHSWLLAFTLADVEKARAWDAVPESMKELVTLRNAKGQDYNDVPGGRAGYFPFGHMSYAHMLHTKNLRVQSLLRGMEKGSSPNFEGLRDTARDLANYAMYYVEAIDRGELTLTRLVTSGEGA
jgi:hypothetical protein